MALPVKKHSKTRTRIRQAHLALSKTGLAECKKCGEKVLPHHACNNCGEYNGRKVLKTKSMFKKNKK